MRERSIGYIEEERSSFGLRMRELMVPFRECALIVQMTKTWMAYTEARTRSNGATERRLCDEMVGGEWC